MVDIAKQIVRTSLNLTNQDVLVVNAWEHTTELASQIAREALKVGAEAEVTYGDDATWLAYLMESDEKYIDRMPTIGSSYAEIATAMVSLWGPMDPKIFDKIKPERFARMSRWIDRLSERQRERKVRSVFVGLAQVTPQRARTYGVSFPKWKQIVNAALAADLKKIAAKGQLVGKNLAGARDVLITGEGTNLALSLSGREAFVSDGIIDANDLARGDVETSLPTGTASLAPVETSADGTVVFPSVPLWGKMIRNLAWTFEDGRLVDFSAERNIEAFKRVYETASGDKDRIGSLTIGLNPKASYLGGFVDHLVAGAVTLGLWKNTVMGGVNKGPFGFGATVPNATLKAGTVTLMDGGKLKV